MLADGAVPGVLPDNCRVRTFRAPHKALRGARFEAALGRELRGLRGGAVVAHMCPIYAVLAAPLVRPLGVPLVLWFTHWRASGLLRAAERVSTAVTSVDRSARSRCRRGSSVRSATGSTSTSSRARLRATGTACGCSRSGATRLRRGSTSRSPPFRSPGDDVELHVHGPALSDEERAHRAELEQLVSELGLDGRVTLGDAVPRSELPELFASARRARQQHARRRAGQGRLRGRGGVSAGARLEPDLRRAARARAALHALGSRRARRRGFAALARADARRARRRSAGGSASGSRPGTRCESWARGILDAAGLS